MSTVGVVGLGVMGSRMARRLVDAGLDVVVHDLEPRAVTALADAGARPAASPRAVADAAAVVLTSLPSAAAARAVALGEDGLHRGGAIRVHVELSTAGAPVLQAIADGLAARDIQVVDSPVSGGPSGAENGTLTLMLAGPAAAIDRARPVLDHLSGKSFVVGESPGQGQVAKVVNNLLMGGALALTGEAVSLGVKSGLDPSLLLQIIDVSTGQNNAASTKFPRQVLTRRFAHGFGLELLTKDVRLCLEQAAALGVPMPVGGAVEQLIELARATSGDDADCTEIVRMIEGWSGVVIGGGPGA